MAMFGEKSGGVFLTTLQKCVGFLQQMDGLDLTVIEQRINYLAYTTLQDIVRGTTFDLNSTIDECKSDKTMEEHVYNLLETVGALEAYEKETVELTMLMCLVLVEKQMLIGLISGTIRHYVRGNGQVALWTTIPQVLRKFYCIGQARLLGLDHRAYDFRIPDHLLYLIDLNCGDLIKFTCSKTTGKLKMCQQIKGSKQQDYIQMRIQCYDISAPDGGLESKRFQLSHLVGMSLDKTSSLFEIPQRFAVFRGYYNRTSKEFTRPEDNCVELAGNLTQACKTDYDHTLGYRNNSIFCLWPCHHATNCQFHQIRDHWGKWLHPYSDEAYAEKQSDRALPSFM